MDYVPAYCIKVCPEGGVVLPTVYNSLPCGVWTTYYIKVATLGSVDLPTV